MNKNKLLLAFLALALVLACNEPTTDTQTKARVQTLLYLE